MILRRVLAIALAALLGAGCPKQVETSLDATLPEDLAPQEARAPEGVLAASAEGLEPSQRARALELLIAHAPEPAGGPWGARTLWDPSAWVQRSGVDALGRRLTEPESVAQLEAYVARADTDPYVRARAATLLGPGSEVAKRELSAAWRAADEPWEIAPLALAAASLGDAEAVPALGEALASGEIGLEVEFVLDVGRSGLVDTLPSLREGAGYVEDELVLPYAAAQLLLGDPSGEQALRKALSDPDEELRLEALDYLSRLEGEAAEALLRKAVAAGPDLVTWYAQLALAARSGEDTPALERVAAEADPEARALAARFAAESWQESLGGRRIAKVARKVLRGALEDEDATVRTVALRAVAELHLDDMEDLVHANLQHPEEQVRIEAAAALLGGSP